MQDCIEKEIVIHAPVARVWRAITDFEEFGEWFRVKLEEPFAPGKVSAGYILHPGYEHLRMAVTVQRMDTERLFSYTWHPYAIEPGKDYSHEKPTLVKFNLETAEGGTLLRISECGFNSVPADRRDLAFRMNENGWAAQLGNIVKYVQERP